MTDFGSLNANYYLIGSIQDGQIYADRRYPRPDLTEEGAIDAYLKAYTREQRRELIITADSIQFVYLARDMKEKHFLLGLELPDDECSEPEDDAEVHDESPPEEEHVIDSGWREMSITFNS